MLRGLLIAVLVLSQASATGAVLGEAPPTLKAACGLTNVLEAHAFWARTADGVRLYMVEAGSGNTTVVLAHGGRSDLCDTIPFAGRLDAAGYRIVALDFRGSGRSEAPARSGLALGMDLAAAVAHARQRGAERIFLIGSSMGGAAIVQNTSAFRVDGRISLSGTRLWPGFGINDPAGLARIRTPSCTSAAATTGGRLPEKPAASSDGSARPTSAWSSIPVPTTAGSWSRPHPSPLAPAHSSCAGSRAIDVRRATQASRLRPIAGRLQPALGAKPGHTASSHPPSA